nr:hypothetical protein [Tanacetum cinerariifolium]
SWSESWARKCDESNWSCTCLISSIIILAIAAHVAVNKSRFTIFLLFRVFSKINRTCRRQLQRRHRIWLQATQLLVSDDLSSAGKKINTAITCNFW